jgi:sarcosine oxidase
VESDPTYFDAIVLGLGAMGSATLWQLARRGARVLGIDRHGPPHAFGSSHGETRITRLAIGEGVEYTPLAMRSHVLWREIEAQTGESLLTVTGGLILSSAADRAMCHVPGFFDNTVAAARRHGIAHELLDAPEVRRRYPQFRVGDDEVGYFERESGFLRPEACIRAQLALAERSGAHVRRDEAATEISESNGVVTVATVSGTYQAPKLIVTAGAWLPGLLGERWAKPFTVTRQSLFWFDVSRAHERFRPGRFPVFIWELPGRSQPIYGFPAIDGPEGGIKIASERFDQVVTPDTIDRRVDAADAAAVHRDLVAPFFPDVGARCVRSAACLYTSTADARFVIDRDPEMPSVLVASPCSGHGFKHSAAIGEALAELTLGGRSAIDLSGFSLRTP